MTTYRVAVSLFAVRVRVGTEHILYVAEKPQWDGSWATSDVTQAKTWTTKGWARKWIQERAFRQIESASVIPQDCHNQNYAWVETVLGRQS